MKKFEGFLAVAILFSAGIVDASLWFLIGLFLFFAIGLVIVRHSRKKRSTARWDWAEPIR